MDMETGNHSSETASLTEAEAIERLDALDAQTDSTDDNSAALDDSTGTTEEPAHEHSEVEEVTEEGEQSDDSAEEPAGAPELDDKMIIEFEGEKVSLWDLKRSFKRQAALTQKEQAVAEERRSIDTFKQEYASTVNAELARRTELALQVAQHNAPKRPDAALARTNPGLYTEAMAEWEEYEAGVSTLLQQRDQAVRQQQVQAAEQFQKQKDAGFIQLLETHPELNSNAALDELYAHGIKHFSREELDSVADPRMFSVLYGDMMWRKSQAQSAKVKSVAASKPPLSQPGALNSVASTKSEALRKAKANLQKTGSDAAAIAYLDELSKRK